MGTGGYMGEYEETLAEVPADFEQWAKMPYWTLDEGIALLLGQIATYINWDIAKDYQPKNGD